MMSENDWAIVANRKLMRGLREVKANRRVWRSMNAGDNHGAIAHCSVMYPMMRKRVPRKRMNALYLYSISVWNKRSMELVAAK
jgi:hypothetical protein